MVHFPYQANSESFSLFRIEFWILSTDGFRVCERDTHLCCYRADGEAAFLIASAEHCRRTLSITNTSLWEEIKSEWESGDGRSRDENLYIVTKVYTTPACAFHHKTSVVNSDFYVINMQQSGGYSQVPRDFHVRNSPCSLEHLRINTDRYAVLESHEAFARKPLRSKNPHWLQLIQYISPFQPR